MLLLAHKRKNTKDNTLKNNLCISQARIACRYLFHFSSMPNLGGKEELLVNSLERKITSEFWWWVKQGKTRAQMG